MSGCTVDGCRTLDDEQTVHVCEHEKIRCIPQFYKTQGFHEMDSCNVKREQRNNNLRNKYWRNSNRNKLNINTNANEIAGTRNESHVNNSVICKSSSKLPDDNIIETNKSLAGKVGFSARRPRHLHLDKFCVHSTSLVTKSPDYPLNREIVRTNSERGWRDTAGSQGTMSPMSDKDSTLQTKRQSYTSDYLLELRKIPPSLEKPKNLPSIPGIILCKPVLSLANAPIRIPDLSLLSAPIFISASCRQQSPKKSSARSRGSKSSSSSSAPKKKRSEPARKIISLNLSSEVRLHTSKNAWRAASVKTTSSDGIHESFKDVRDKLRGLLNKLSARNFESVSHQISRLPVKDEEIMKTCINVIFEKAVTEPNFSELYAALSKKFSKWAVPTTHGPAKFVSFKDLIITRCQHEFEKDKYGEHDSDPLTPELGPNDKGEGDLDVFKKKRTLGNIRFIGELYMQDMLQEVVIHQCIMDLLKYRNDEDRLESLCKMLTVVGRKIDFLRSKPRIDQYFKRISDILNKKDISSRIRFMLRDIIELRENNWIPRHANSKPQFLRQSSLSINRSNFDVIDSPVKKSISNDESKLCSTLPRNFSYSQKQFGMTTKCPEVKDNSWFKTPPTILNRNMKIKPSKPIEHNNISNTLESKTHLKEKPTSETISEDSLKTPLDDERDVIGLRSHLDELSPDQLERKCTNFLNEYLNVEDFEEAAMFFEEIQAAVSKCCEALIIQSLEKNFTDRSKLGELFIFALSNKHLSSDSFVSSIEGVLRCSEDLEIDIPKVWEYLAEILFRVVLSDPEGIISKMFWENSSLVTNHFKKLMKIFSNMVKVIQDKKGFDESVDVYLNVRKVNPQCLLEEMLMNRTNRDAICTECTAYYKDLQNILLAEDWFPELELQELEKEALKDDRLERIEYMKMLVKLIGKRVTLNEPPSVDLCKLKDSCGYLKRFAEENGLELELLNATQEFVCNIDHPYDVLRSFFDVFYHEDVVSEEVFDSWYYSDDSTSVPGKGVAKESVSKFFEWLHLSEDEYHQ